MHHNCAPMDGLGNPYCAPYKLMVGLRLLDFLRDTSFLVEKLMLPMEAPCYTSHCSPSQGYCWQHVGDLWPLGVFPKNSGQPVAGLKFGTLSWSTPTLTNSKRLLQLLYKMEHIPLPPVRISSGRDHISLVRPLIS